MRLFIFILMILAFASIQFATGQQKDNIDEQPKTEPRKADYPWYWNRPYEDINNFQNSTLGKKRSSVTKGINNSVSTPKSNAEINKQIDEDIEKRKLEQQQYEIGYSSSVGFSVDPDNTVIDSAAIDETETIKGTLSNTKVIRWVDENGVVHVTNDPTEVYKRSN